MRHNIKYWLIGPPLPTQELEEKRLNKIRALAAFSPDALSSIAYANQEIYLGLVVAGSAGLALTMPIGVAITLLLVLVAFSYFQTIHAYPSGGGSYIVALENLGTLPGLIAGAALMIGYLLTAAVSLTAAVAAIASAFPALWPYRVPLALFFLAIITLANLRGIRESGTLMAVPVYFFVITYLGMLAYGTLRLLIEGPGTPAIPAPPPMAPLSLGVILNAFASGCTALTGIEAISNGVPVFHPPESKNAGQTLLIMALLMGLLFVGSVGLTQEFSIVANTEETVLSALAHRILGNSIAYYIIQLATMLILTVAANTSFAGFPRLTAMLAEAGFLPRQLRNLGERLVYTNGIIFLALATGVLIVLFGGDTHALVPLFAVGVFSAFTLSQAGMVVHWWRERGAGWLWKLVLNGIGALATGLTVLIVGVSKFVAGAWITIILVPLLVVMFLRIRQYYRETQRQLSLRDNPPTLKTLPAPRIVIPISGVHRGIFDAVAYARSISRNVTAVYVAIDPGQADRVREAWERWFPDVPLAIVPSPYRTILKPLLDYLDQTDQEHNDGQLATVIVPELVPSRWWQGALHNQTALLLKAALLYRRRQLGYQRAIIDIPYHLRSDL
ncbi:MAG TPA: APC family permease [Anaerolineae bacterium]|nr:APC family permease [Anaerolineae bacterium]HQK14826.1 APC family permease [Anaerolineae bacterium]